MLNIGKVKFFDIRDSKRFGFIFVDEGKELFFHLNNGQSFAMDNIYPRFSGTRTNRIPTKDDLLVYVCEQTEKGPRAKVWGFLEEYDHMQDQMANRPVYRVVKVIRFVGSDPADPEIVWEGWNVEELSEKFPRTGSHRTDHLQTGICCGDFDVYNHFEALNRDGDEWTQCEDPRPVRPDDQHRRWRR